MDTTFIRYDEKSATGVALITLDSVGQNTIVVAPGANMQVSPRDIEEAEAAFEGADLLLTQLECPLETVQAAVRMAHRHGLRVVLNPAPAHPLPAELLPQIDYLLPNEPELCRIVEGQMELSSAAGWLKDNGISHLVVTLGEQGALLITSDSQEKFPAFAVQVVDTVAAGDAFAGAFCVALIEGRPLREAVIWGNAAGAIAVTRPGAQPSLPTREELMQFLEEKKAI